MNPNSDLTNLIYFLVGVFLNVAGIWIGIFLYLRQQKKDLERKYDLIIHNLRIVQQELLNTKDRLDRLDQSENETRIHYVEMHSQLLMQLTQAQIKLSDLIPIPKDPELANKLKSLGQDVGSIMR